MNNITHIANLSLIACRSSKHREGKGQKCKEDSFGKHLDRMKLKIQMDTERRADHWLD